MKLDFTPSRFLPRFLGLFALLNLILWLTACSTSWITDAEGIIATLIPAVEGIFVLLSSLGAALPASALTSIQTWGTAAQNDLQNVVLPLIQQYNAAEAGAKPGILTQIQTVLATITSNLATILPALHVTDPATQAKIQDIVTEVGDEITALMNLIPVIQSAATQSTADVLKALAAKPEVVGKLKSAGQFKKDFNKDAVAFGQKYKNYLK